MTVWKESLCAQGYPGCSKVLSGLTIKRAITLSRRYGTARLCCDAWSLRPPMPSVGQKTRLLACVDVLCRLCFVFCVLGALFLLWVDSKQTVVLKFTISTTTVKTASYSGEKMIRPVCVFALAGGTHPGGRDTAAGSEPPAPASQDRDRGAGHATLRNQVAF